jgi:hypothetical protein
VVASTTLRRQVRHGYPRASHSHRSLRSRRIGVVGLADAFGSRPPARGRSNVLRRPPRRAPYRGRLGSQDDPKRPRLRRIPAGGRARPADNSATSARDRSSFRPRPSRDGRPTPSPSPCPHGPGVGPASKSKRSGAASAAPNPHQTGRSSPPAVSGLGKGSAPDGRAYGGRRRGGITPRANTFALMPGMEQQKVERVGPGRGPEGTRYARPAATPTPPLPGPRNAGAARAARGDLPGAGRPAETFPAPDGKRAGPALGVAAGHARSGHGRPPLRRRRGRTLRAIQASRRRRSFLPHVKA